MWGGSIIRAPAPRDKYLSRDSIFFFFFHFFNSGASNSTRTRCCATIAARQPCTTTVGAVFGDSGIRAQAPRNKSVQRLCKSIETLQYFFNLQRRHQQRANAPLRRTSCRPTMHNDGGRRVRRMFNTRPRSRKNPSRDSPKSIKNAIFFFSNSAAINSARARCCAPIATGQP